MFLTLTSLYAYNKDTISRYLNARRVIRDQVLAFMTRSKIETESKHGGVVCFDYCNNCEPFEYMKSFDEVWPHQLRWIGILKVSFPNLLILLIVYVQASKEEDSGGDKGLERGPTHKGSDPEAEGYFHVSLDGNC